MVHDGLDHVPGHPVLIEEGMEPDGVHPGVVAAQGHLPHGLTGAPSPPGDGCRNPPLEPIPIDGLKNLLKVVMSSRGSHPLSAGFPLPKALAVFPDELGNEDSPSLPRLHKPSHLPDYLRTRIEKYPVKPHPDNSFPNPDGDYAGDVVRNRQDNGLPHRLFETGSDIVPVRQEIQVQLFFHDTLSDLPYSLFLIPLLVLVPWEAEG